MAEKRNRTGWIVLALAAAGAGALAITSPRDDTKFVSVAKPVRVAKPAAGKTPARPAGDKGQAPAMGLAPDAEDLNAAQAPDPVAPPPGTAANRNLFQPLVVSGRAGVPPESMPLLPAGMEGLLPLPDVNAPAGSNQRAYWEYVGTVRLNGVTYALIEEKKSKAGAYLKLGDGFRGGHVLAIRPDCVILELAGKRYTLPKSSGLTEEKAAAVAAPPPTATVYAPGQPGAATPPGVQPATPGAVAPGAQPGMPGAPTAAPVDPTRAAEMQADPTDDERAQRRQRWMQLRRQQEAGGQPAAPAPGGAQ